MKVNLIEFHYMAEYTYFLHYCSILGIEIDGEMHWVNRDPTSPIYLAKVTRV
jgi:hypothetical protein